MKDIDNIFREEPRRQLWEKLDEQLSNNRKVKKIRLYRIASLAAMFVALVAVVSYFNHILNDHNPHLFASNENYSSLVLEELEYDENGIFNLEALLEITKAYKKKEIAQSQNVIGVYAAKDGEINMTIGLKNLKYTLTLSYDDFPLMELDKIAGQTWYFASGENYSLKLNLEPYGFKIIESNFLPEYKGYMFSKLNSI